jgi:hypothetical protein
MNSILLNEAHNTISAEARRIYGLDETGNSQGFAAYKRTMNILNQDRVQPTAAPMSEFEKRQIAIAEAQLAATQKTSRNSNILVWVFVWIPLVILGIIVLGNIVNSL